MSVSATEAVTNAGLYQPATTTTANSADKTMFLNLMVAQLRYQDPSNPTDSSQMMAQNAQFTALEKMQDVADQTAALLSAQISFGAAGMVGKNVTYLDRDGSAKSGLVGSVTYDESGPMLVVDGASVSLGQVQSISATATPTATPSTPPATPATPSTPPATAG
ncbi:flagellar hook assembly protein FlgD [Nocardioides sp. URHA0020]|uniref:flagellar hook assembly protein FlgD n=1 Tax=Nocardioides sp. URHA0020 TaxID=1380392 RepID=UPI000686B6E1|nr:flagellar hook capping FlgD N-terminal domain-containing protein [Nocardioides sp. URHA0020]